MLAKLQSEILGPLTTLQQMGIRQSPVFVGEAIRNQEVVHYVAPPSEDLELMLGGVMTFLDRTQGQSSVMRSAVAAFGFLISKKSQEWASGSPYEPDGLHDDRT